MLSDSPTGGIACIRDIANPDTAAIVRSVVRLDAHLGTAITAEGVETQAQLERMREEGCTDVQGFLFSPPLSTEDARRFTGVALVGVAA
ncbi:MULTISPECIES: EAL domain-containing protein [unclassified Methylobacterium]|jgi:EAL domain-containing protein (putative c-di-GMP-specific phosphodiesterase class I)|uniref:EAL domain-containing protein n=1 Tax=unclassified Methylobacterium TaxID=2615210 RepID=UPI0005BD7C45|nr:MULTISPECIES: EAL domain-containing protein [unclassified Methylobacterium]SFU97530.1 EAL domain-containing protein [Methylobacterium sp. UNCCL125]